jgi:Uroporphyrinogen-III decarboxylase
VFWGGGCDTQHVLPFGTVEAVEEDVKRRIDVLAPGGGFVFASIHNIQMEISPEKILRLYETAFEYGRGEHSGERAVRPYSCCPIHTGIESGMNHLNLLDSDW